MEQRGGSPGRMPVYVQGWPPPGKGLKVINMSARSWRALNVQGLAQCLAHSRHTVNASHIVVDP